MNANEQVSTILFETPFFKVIQEGKYYAVTEKSPINGAVVVAENEEGEIMLVRHFRPAIQKLSIEFPRGGRDNDEDLSETARRELLEETGFQATEFIHLGNIHSNTSLIRSEMAIYHAKSVRKATDETDGEIDACFFVSRSQLKQLVREGSITDAHTLSAIALM